MSKPKVLSAGQCGFDHGAIQRVLHSLGAEVESADTVARVLELAKTGNYSLILLNRVFDRTGEQGLECLKALKDPKIALSTPIILVSNYPEAQAEARALGAESGFGKSTLGDAHTKELLSTVLSSS